MKNKVIAIRIIGIQHSYITDIESAIQFYTPFRMNLPTNPPELENEPVDSVVNKSIIPYS